MNLIIGNGLIGRHIYYKLRGDAVLLTRKELDLSRDNWDLPKCSIAYVCAAITSTKLCEEKPEWTRLVNVFNTVKLIEKLKPSKVVWFSSERVFDGSVPFREPTAQVCPTTEYGRQKAEVERLLSGVTIVRLSKVIGWDVPLFEEWITRLEQDLPIYPYSNVSMSPMPIGFVSNALLQLGEGLFQISGDSDLSYSRIAYYIANYMGKDLGLVQPISSSEPHPYTTLKNNTGVDTPVSWETIQEWCKNRLPTRA